MLGIALGVAALIIVLSVMNGFQKEVRERMLSVVSHIEVLAPGGAAYLVVQKNLGSDSLQSWLGEQLDETFTVRRYASAKGFRLLEVSRAA